MTEERTVPLSPEKTCDRLGALAATANPPSPRAPDARQWAAIEARLDGFSWRLALRRRWPVLGVTAVALACAVGWVAARRTLSYGTKACTVSPDGTLRSLGGGAIAFEDGSRLDLAAGTALRIKPLAFKRGAELSLDDGEAQVAVVHQRDTRWAVLAGPFRTEITGTRFSVRWSPRDGRFRIAMTEGEVHVSGGPVPANTPLRTTQILEAEAGQFVVREAVPVPPVPPPTAAAPPPAIEAVPAPVAKARTTSTSPSPRPSTTAASAGRPASAARRGATATLVPPPAAVEPPTGPAPSLAPNLPPAPQAPPAPTAPLLVPPATAWPAPATPPPLPTPTAVRVSIAPDGRLSGDMTGFAWVAGGEGTVFSMPAVKEDRARLRTTDGQLCAHGRLARWACVNEGTPHIRCNWDRNWGVAIGFFVKSDETAWGAAASSAIAIDFRGRSNSYRLVAHRKDDPADKVYCVESYKSGQVVKPGQLKSRCWDDAGDTLPDFKEVESFSLQASSGLDYVAFRYCITGISAYHF